MQLFGEFKFFIYLIVALTIAIVLGSMKKSLKIYNLILSIVFILLALNGKPSELLYLFGFYVYEIILIKLYLYINSGYPRNGKLFLSFVALSLLPLIVNKVLAKFEISIFGFLGISYLTFKVIQIIIEVYDGVIKEVELLELSSFILFFPALSSGPIDRSRRFNEDYNKVYDKEEYFDLVGEGIFKIILGILYKFVLASIFNQLMTSCEAGDQWFEILGYMYTYGFYLFFDFAGYSLMAIGTSYILGIKTPDNFNKPFISVDIKEFWNRWHITLSHWFRDFIFSRFMMKAIKKKWFKTKLTGAAIGFIINMFVMGIWHGLSWNYIIYGLYHGVLLALLEIYQKKSKFYKRNKNKKLFKVISWFITFQLVMFGFLIFSGHLSKVN